jgi:flagellar basal-body rod protein FlgF
MDKMIFTSLNSIQNLYDQRFNISQNMANISVPGYRRELPNEGGSAFLEQYQKLGPRAYALETGPNQFSFKIGSISSTGNKTDIAIANNSFMLAETENGDVVFTKRGDLQVSSDGILKNGEGVNILSENLTQIQLPFFSDIKISRYGEILLDTAQTPSGIFSSFGIISSVDPSGFNLLKDTDGKIKHFGENDIAADQSGAFVQGSLEMSNVNPVEEMVASIDNQRQFELNMKLIKAAEEADRSGMSLLKISQ